MDLAARIDQLRTLSPEQLAERATRVLPPWVGMILAIALAWQLAKLTWLFAPAGDPGAAGALPMGTTSAVAQPTGSASVDVQKIVDAHLFGVPDADPQPIVQTSIEVDRRTKLNLTLRGTIAADDPQFSLAIISEERGEEKVFSVGDTIMGGAKLHAVSTDRVILERAGELEYLPLPKEYDQTSSAGRTAATPRPTRTQQARPTQTANLQQMIMQNPAALTDIIRPQPVFVNGKQRGYRVYPGRNRQQFTQLGLQPGDLVTEINGMPLNDPTQGMQVFKSLGDATQVSVTVERNGQPQQLSLDTSQLSTSSGNAASNRQRRYQPGTVNE